MQAFKTITDILGYLPISNIDTDMIIAKQHLKTIKKSGLGAYLFSELRFEENKVPPLPKTQILLTQDNFGCGSSREHAVWSLLDFGIKVIIAPSFADIFYSNCFKNGLLPITLPSEAIATLIENRKTPVTVCLKSQKIKADTFEIPFSIDAHRRETLLKGLDEIGETLVYENDITSFEAKQRVNKPWLFLGEHKHA